MKTQIPWTGEKNRPLSLQRPCDCGCDGWDGKHGVGYLTASDERGKGFTIWIESEAVYRRLKAAMIAARMFAP